MRKGLAIAALSLSLAGCSVVHHDPWTRLNTVEAGGLVAANMADAVTTSRIHGNCYETNAIMGRHPSNGIVAVYFLGITAAELGAAYVMPKYMRDAFLVGATGVEAYWAVHNVELNCQ